MLRGILYNGSEHLKIYLQNVDKKKRFLHNENVMVNDPLPSHRSDSVDFPSESEDIFSPPLKTKKRTSQKHKLIYLSIGILGFVGLLIPGIFMVQQSTRLFSQAWEKISFRDLRSQYPENADLNDPRYATMSAKLVGRRCPQPEKPQLPAGKVLLFENETGTVFTYPIAKDTIEFNSTLLAGKYYLFFQPEGDPQPYFAAASDTHDLIEINLQPKETSETIQICDSQYISNWLPAELQPGAKTDPLQTQREALNLTVDSTASFEEEFTPSKVHGTVCPYGQNVFPAGSVMFYDSKHNELIVHKLRENENSFSIQVPPGEYAVFFAPQNQLLPIYAFTQYVTCGLDPNNCPDHNLLLTTLQPAEEYGGIQICDPQYNQTGLPANLTYENK